MIWQSLNVLKSAPQWKVMDKDYKYTMLGLTDKDLEEIAISRQKRIERRAKKKAVL
jgi:hypothetical protein